MKKLFVVLSFMSFISLIAVKPVFAQATPSVRDKVHVVDSTKIQIITLRDRSNLIGRVVNVRGDSVEFQMAVGRVTLATGDIQEIKERDATVVHNGQYWFPNPNYTRLFFAPSGQMLKQGEGYFADYELFFPGIAYGLTDNISIGGGVSLFPAGLDEQVYFITPKVGASFGDQIHVAAGLMVASTQGETGGIGYGVGTVGNGDASFTVGFGYGFAGGEIASKPLLLVGGEKRLSRRIAVVTENYVLPTDDANLVFSFGVRFMGENLTTDLALFNVAGDNAGEGIGFPFVDFVFKF
ncbi:MAG TPA: hypothetical protein VNC11_15635 [Gemmatimonadaceae bacterium]|nr:hypothetical protein [Gemmatimonadaceae bacterium]